MTVRPSRKQARRDALFLLYQRDVTGIVRQILVEDGETVQYGQPLFAIEPV